VTATPPRRVTPLVPLAAALREAERTLRDAGVTSARVDAELLVAHLLRESTGTDVSRGEVQAAALLGRPAPDGFDELVARRARREPLQHLTGRAPFRGVELHVGAGVFVPRPETEQVAEHAVREAAAVVARTGSAAVADLCTGSGAIAVSVAVEVPGALVHAVELDHDAHTWARRNVEGHAPGVHLVRGDARTALRELDGTLDVVVSNPPYVPPGAVPVDVEVALHDPAVALYGLGEDGLEVPRGIVAAAARLLRPGGLLVMEHAEVQAAAARAVVEATGTFEDVTTAADLTGRPRMVLARRRAGAGGGVPSCVGDSQP
jgi:release factor glutamine methyltransferase